MALSFPVAQPKPLSPEELQPLKALLAARAQAASRLPAQTVADQLSVTSGELVAAYEIALQVLTETRGPKLETVTRPLAEGMAVPDAASPLKEPVNVWEFASEKRADFSAHRGVYLIPSTLQRKECKDCLQKGNTNCRSCLGKGEAACQTCLGAGAQSCHMCKGLGKTNCLKCEGQGKIQAGGLTNKVLGPCEACKGTGKFPCNRCVNGKLDCATCASTGKRACPSCEGKGRLLCPSCKGASKLVSGMAFQAEFRPQQAVASALAVEGPRAAVDLALAQKSPVGAFEIPPEQSLEKEAQESSLPESLKAAVLQAYEKVKPPHSSARVVRQKISVFQGALLRVSGNFAGKDLVYWVHPQTKTVVPEKDPIRDFSQASSEEAQKAAKTGDWEKALDAAEDTLKFDPANAGARGIALEWRKRVLRECLALSLGAGVLAALAGALGIFLAEKGLHRIGPALLVALVMLSAGAAAGAGLFPAAKRIFQTRKRLSVSGSAGFAAVFLFFGLTRGLLGWDPVKSADQAALGRDMKEKFKFGVSKVYWEPDMTALQGLYETYKDSRADLAELNRLLETQTALKTERDALTQEFRQKLDQILYAESFASQKRAQVAELRDYYALRSVDVAPAEEALKTLDAQLKQGGGQAPKRGKGRLSITPAGSSKPAARAPSKKTPSAGKAAGKKSSAAKSKEKLKPAKSAKKKKVVPAKKKKKGWFQRDDIDPVE